MEKENRRLHESLELFSDEFSQFRAFYPQAGQPVSELLIIYATE
jgi:hypothetical protein